MPRPRTVAPRSPEHAALGKAIELLIAEGVELTSRTVVQDSGLDEKQLGTYIRGQGNPTYTNLLKVCKGLHVGLATLMRRAERMHEQLGELNYVVVFERAADGAWRAYLPDMPDVVAFGASRSEVSERIEQALATYRQDLRSRGRSLPPPQHTSTTIAA